jgi:hypothetical protein
MSNTPYFDAYEKYKASRNRFNLSITKKYITLSTGEVVLQDIEFLDEFGNEIYSHDIFNLR